MADARARTGTRPQAFVGDGHAPIGTDFEQGAAAPDIRPPGAERDWAQDAALVALGGARGGAGRAEARWRIRGWCWLRRRRAPVGGPASIDAGVRFCPGPGACARSARRRRKRGGRPRVGSARRGVRPVRSVVAAGGAQRPGRCVRTGGGAQIVAVEFVETCANQPEFLRRGGRRRGVLGSKAPIDDGRADDNVFQGCRM